MNLLSPIRGLWVFCFFAMGAGVTLAQPVNPEDANINAIRGLSSISNVDQAKIERWINQELDNALQAVAAKPDAGQLFQQRLQTQLRNPANSPAFTNQLVTQLATIAAARFTQPNFDWHVAHFVAVELANLKNKEAIPALFAGLKSQFPVIRAVCARGLDDHKAVIVQDQARFPQFIQELQAAGVAEQSAPVLSRIYLALGYSAQAPQVFDAYMAILDRRLADRRKNPTAIDGAELQAFEFFADPQVLKALNPNNPNQKAALAARVAVFFRLDAELYNTPNLNSANQQILEQLLFVEEEILEGCVGANPQSGKVREQLGSGGWANRKAIMAEVAKWTGDAANNVQGVLNAAPWSVPAGAP